MKKIFTKILIILDVLAITILFVFYGPFSLVRDWYITTALTTNSHKYLAYMLYSQETIDQVLEENRFYQVTETSESELITFKTSDSNELTELEKQIVNHSVDEEYKIIEIERNNFVGWITVIYDPSRIDLAISDSNSGDTVSEIAEDNDAIIAVNGGGFEKSNNKRTAMGGLIYQSQLYSKSDSDEELIYMTNEGKLMLAYSTAQEIYESGDVKWLLHFSPFLIVNGVSSTSSGNAGGYHPRTAIGQRADGTIILLTIDGRGSNGSIGATLQDLVDIFEECGCINAANLDGGASTTLYAEGEIINDPASRKNNERSVFDALIYR